MTTDPDARARTSRRGVLWTVSVGVGVVAGLRFIYELFDRLGA